MNVLVATFVKEPGGIAQAFTDYCEALSLRRHHVHAVIRDDMPESFQQHISAHSNTVSHLNPKGYYDLRALLQLRKLIKKHKPDVVIAHSNRAISLLRKVCFWLGVPCIGVNHSYNVKRSIGMDGIIALTPHMQKHISSQGQAEEHIHVVPNLIRLRDAHTHTQSHTPVTIGALSCFDDNKGLHHLIDAIAALKKQGISCRAILGGDGVAREKLEQQVDALALRDDIIFVGWVDDKDAFFNAIDIFCLPSLAETFGIVLLEAMAHNLPVVASRTYGPSHIINHNQNGVLCDIGNSQALAVALDNVINDTNFRKSLAHAGLETVKQHYDIKAVAKTLESVLSHYVR